MSTILETVQGKVQNYLSSTRKMLINGEWVPSVSGKVYESINPANGEVLVKIYEADSEDVDRAVQAAREAFKDWSKTPPAVRTALLNKLADLIEQRGEELAYLESLDYGCTRNFAQFAFVQGAAAHLRYYAGWATKLTGDTMVPTTGANVHAYTKREPIGVCGQITSWNFPLLGACWKLAAPLAAGCTVVLKPSQQTTLTTLLLGELIQEAGFPSGVVNIIAGPGGKTGEAISSHPDIDKIGFTGSTVVGKGIMRNASTNLKKITLELGGKSPNIIFADADLEKAIQGVVAGASFYNQGQVCVAGTRVYVERSVYNEVVEQLTAIVKSIKVGNPQDPETVMGPLVSKQQLETVLGYIESAKKDGATILAGGKQPDDVELSKGYYLEPTLITGLTENCKAVNEEIFGPVLAILPFDSIGEVIERANLTQYGLAAGVWTKDISKAHKMIDALEAGSVWVNGYMLADDNIPLSGYKQSGVGTEMAYEGIKSYTKAKSVVINLD
jgi:acyl-CoA reductase-like NAD-dependent aldehyde dehydrogenase